MSLAVLPNWLQDEPEQAPTEAAFYCYAIVDAAQDQRLPQALSAQHSACLLGTDVTIQQASPHLVALGEQAQLSTGTLRRLAQQWAGTSCVILLRSQLDFDALLQHLIDHVEVKVNKSTTMLLAWWDPAILAPLLGEPADRSNYVQGPIFTEQQRHSFLAPIENIAWWNRAGELQQSNLSHLEKSAPADEHVKENPLLPLQFEPWQVRMMVKATLPDQVLYEIGLNQPNLLRGRDTYNSYRSACELLDAAEGYGIKAKQEQVTFVGAGFMLGERFYDVPFVHERLVQAKKNGESFGNVLRSLNSEDIKIIIDADK